MNQNQASIQAEDATSVIRVGGVVVGVPFALTAIRCTLQYILVPFVLPFFGMRGGLSPIVNISAGLLGLGVVSYNLFRLWNTSWRSRYLLLSLIIIPFILLGVFFDYIAYLANQ